MCVNNCHGGMILLFALSLATCAVGCRNSDKDSNAGSGPSDSNHQERRNLPDNVELSSVKGVSIIQCPAHDYPEYSVLGDGTSETAEAKTAPLYRVIHDWCDFNGWLFIDAPLPNAAYNITVKVDAGQTIWPLAKHAFEDVFGLRFVEAKETLDVVALQKAEDSPRGLSRVEAQSSLGGSNQTADGYGYKYSAGTMGDLTEIISKYVDEPVVDETGLTGFYKFTLSMDHWKPQTVFPAVEKLGLKLKRTKCELPVMRVVSAQDKAPTSSPTPPASFSGAGRDADGFITYTINSPRQSKPTKLRIILPDEAGKAPATAPTPGKDLAKPAPPRVLYILPVEAGEGNHYGDGLAEVRKLGLHNRYRLICVKPTFSALPWYADHPTDPNCRQESYFIQDILPFVERTFHLPDDPNCRLLVGFSKSGWGAWCLLLRHPDVFARAAAWDAPLTETSPKYGMKDIVATQDNFEKYRITALLASAATADAAAPAHAHAHAKKFLSRPARLALHGYGGFRAQHQEAHDLMTKLQIPHDYRDGPARKHTWSSGWLEDAVGFVARPSPEAAE